MNFKKQVIKNLDVATNKKVELKNLIKKVLNNRGKKNTKKGNKARSKKANKKKKTKNWIRL